MAGIAAARIEFANKHPILGEEVQGPLLAREDIAGATAVLLRSWPSVRALEEAVMVRGKLSGDEAERIAIDAMPAQGRTGLRSLLEQAASSHADEGPEEQNDP